MSTDVRITKCGNCGQRLGNWKTLADGRHECVMCKWVDENSVAKHGEIRFIEWGEGGNTTLAWIISVSDSGVVRFVKPNPWAHRPGDPRAGWTKPMTCKLSDVQRNRPTRQAVEAVVLAIGRPPGGGA